MKSQKPIQTENLNLQQVSSLQTVSKTQAWLMAARPKTLPAAIGPVLVGSALAYADGRFAFFPALAALIGALLLQIGSNFANDYFDFFKGADTAERLGPTRATASGLLTPNEMRWGMVIIFALSALVGLYLIWVGGWPILALGGASILAAIAYTGGPIPFGYYGLGDLFCFLFFGLAAVCGTYYVQGQYVTFDVWLAGAAVGSLITAILIVNNLRDIDSDRRAGKRTLAVLLGRHNTKIEYLVLLISAYSIAVWLWLGSDRSVGVMLTWLSLPFAALLTKNLWQSEGRALNTLLASTARLSLLYSVLLAVGLLLG